MFLKGVPRLDGSYMDVEIRDEKNMKKILKNIKNLNQFENLFFI